MMAHGQILGTRGRRRLVWRAAALFYRAGAIVTVPGVLLPHQAGVDETGYAVLAAHGAAGASLDELLHAADERLYVAKREAQSAFSSRRMPATGMPTQSGRLLSS